MVQEPNWDSPATREPPCAPASTVTATRRCGPGIAASHRLRGGRGDTDQARDYLNFSDRLPGDVDPEDVAEVINEGEMPPAQYKLIHAARV